jgi:FkbM family methyltransferase
MYFPRDLVKPVSDEVFVDCGAFDGDTIRMYLAARGEKFRRIYALEPDATNRESLASFLASLTDQARSRITVLPFAAWNETARMSFSAANAGLSSIMSGALTDEIECRALDDVLTQEPPTYIKMDIEAAEPQALAGAQRLLRTHSPVVAACVYHRSEHLWQIPLQLKRASHDYSISLRRYAEEAWEMVCYAVPPSRSAH